MNNPYTLLFLAVISIFSTIFGIYTWCAGKQRKELSVYYKSDILIKAGKQRIPKLDILYDGNEIDDLSSTKLYIWNSGNQVLNNSDIVSSRPPRVVSANNATLLDVQIIRSSDTTNAFSISQKNENAAQFDFEYIDHGDGILVQILHTGNYSDIEFDCKIKGGREIKDRSPTRKDKKQTFTDKFLDFVATEFAFAVWIIITFGGIFLVINLLSIFEGEKMTLAGFLILFTSIGICFFLGLKLSKAISKFANNLFHRAIPESLLTTGKKE